jgi:hypothetical protein
MIILDHEQGSDEWLRSRLGRPSASNFHKLITSTGKPSSQAEAYINQMIFERHSGIIESGYKSAAMDRGNEIEPEAREFYSFLTGNEVLEVGFVVDPTFQYGCSPDGLIGSTSGLEIKCPAGHTHMGWLRGGKLPDKHKCQVQACMWICQRDSWDFLSYHPHCDHFLITVERDQGYIDLMAEQVAAAVDTIVKTMEKLK